MQRGGPVGLSGVDVVALRDELERDIATPLLDGVGHRAGRQSGTYSQYPGRR
jgi:hypothetical protein